MECAVITTYRCNARCQMCRIWQNPTRRSEEFSPQILEKLPGGMKRLNISRGEPGSREDILDIVGCCALWQRSHLCRGFAEKLRQVIEETE